MGYFKNAEIICEELLENISDKYAKGKGYWLWEIMKAIACELSDLTAEMDDIRNKLFVEGLQGDELDDYVENWTYITRKKMTQATGYVTFRAKENQSGAVEQGTIVATDGNVLYITIERAEITEVGGSVEVPVAAVEYGEKGNCKMGEICRLITGIDFIDSVENLNEISGGQNEESDNEVRNRYFETMRKAANAGNAAFYVEKAKTVEGVAEAFCVPCPNNAAGTVDLYVADVEGKQVTEAVLETVQNLIDPNRNGDGAGVAPIGAVCTVKNPNLVEIDVTAKVTFSSEANVEEVKAELRQNVNEYLNGCFGLGSVVRIAQIIKIICSVKGVIDVENVQLNGNSGNIESSGAAVFMLGVLEFE